MKRFLLFAGYGYYPKGGWSDFVGDYDTREETSDVPVSGDWSQIVDQVTRSVEERVHLKREI